MTLKLLKSSLSIEHFKDIVMTLKLYKISLSIDIALWLTFAHWNVGVTSIPYRF